MTYRLFIGRRSYTFLISTSQRKYPVVWSEHRRFNVWSVLIFVGNHLHVPMYPQVASVFVSMHKFLSSRNEMDYTLWQVVIAAFMSVCKANETPRPVDTVFSSFLKSCRDLQRRNPSSNFLDAYNLASLEDRKVTDDEVSIINRCEIDLLFSRGFVIEIKLPFAFADKNVCPFLPGTSKNEIYVRITKDLCISIMFDVSLNCNPEAIAIASTEYVFGEREMPQQVVDWIVKAKAEIGDAEIKKANDAMIQSRQSMQQHQGKHK